MNLVVRGSKEWANECLRWFLQEILYTDTWKAHPYYKLFLGQHLALDLESEGFTWQASRIRNHVHKWLASCKPEGFDPEGREGFS
jgi:hypothetical protein